MLTMIGVLASCAEQNKLVVPTIHSLDWICILSRQETTSNHIVGSYLAVQKPNSLLHHYVYRQWR